MSSATDLRPFSEGFEIRKIDTNGTTSSVRVGGRVITRSMIVTLSAALLCSVVTAAAQPATSAEDQRCEAVRDRFNEARARQDADAMAAVFAQDAVRITPDGVFQGRDAIRQNLAGLATAGLRDFTTERTVSRREGPLLFDAGTWHAKLGEQPLHGYYSALLSCAGDRPEIVEETTNVAAPPRH
jgi:ketosteroid isomerase-like protein